MCSLFCIMKSILVGYIIGIIISIPLGPSAIESVNRTISRGFKEGLVVSLGAVSADITYLFFVNCGIFSLFKLSKDTEALFWTLSGVVMILIGYSSLSNKEVKKSQNVSKKCDAFFTGYVITLCNPMTPTLWITLSATVLNRWHSKGGFLYTLSILSMIGGMISWFILLNVSALKGLKLAKPKHSNKITIIIRWSILVLGIIFSALGIYKFFT
ncbi:LysE family translocator [Clostridium botulinum]|uniref:Lysine transporter LysE n=1 Tax=Clostridium botulinum TaxID=1491 RepID=A0A9Q1ZCD0_CLOBO|nr:LysE family transporter [Clostridium botulinum]KEI02731.1 lysine transporter LysE [Clostridium botulinum D str. 16868]KLU74908.1 lysine transporter LysE [Clostridium botulinum V891]KEH99893.1 lysine transporter LysE [Clostridium botulinum C/D str. Sp77]KOA77077.1 lysine transporter LysE [Clostridium botulinum]KOA80209.1 lysine transporter LysE [Clostridium botulinum]